MPLFYVAIAINSLKTDYTEANHHDHVNVN